MSRNTGTALRPDQGPWRASRCDAYYFLLEADRSALQALVDRGLNTSAGGPRFKVMVDAVAMTLQQFTNMKILPAGASSPLIHYPEAAFFVMVADTQTPGRVYIWAPFMYCANVLATISGREVFGFPKEFGVIAFDGKQFFASAQGLVNPVVDQPQTYEPVTLPVIEGGIEDAALEQAAEPLSAPVDFDKLRADKNLEGAHGLWDLFGGLASVTGQWISLLIEPAISFMLVRSRFEAGSGAWDSELLTAHSPVHQVSLQRFMAPTRFRVAEVFSHRLVSQLGLITEPGTVNLVRPMLGCKLVLDFSLHPPQPL